MKIRSSITIACIGLCCCSCSMGETKGAEASQAPRAGSTTAKARLMDELPYPWKGNSRPSDRPGDFYVALFNKPSWLPATSSDCVDASTWAWIRKIFTKDTASISIIATIKINSGSETIRLPLFTASATEKPSPGQPKCVSESKETLLTPWYRADSNTTFDINFEVGTSKTGDVDGGKKILSATQDILKFAGSTSFIVTKLTGKQLQSAGQQLDASITDNLSVSTLDNIIYQFQALPNNLTDSQVDGLEFSTKSIESKNSGISFSSDRTPAFKIGLVYTSSVFANNGQYPSDYTEILTRPLAPQFGFSPSTIVSLLNEGLGGISKDGISQIASRSDAENRCRELRLQLSRGFSYKDALVSRYALLRQYSPQVFRNSQFRTGECIDSKEESQLAELQYIIPSSDREPGVRSDDVEARMQPLTRALRSSNAASLTEIVTLQKDTLRLSSIGSSKDFPPYQNGEPDWNADGDQAITKLLYLGKRARLGCFKVAPQSTINQIGAVGLVDGQSFGLIFYWTDDGKLEQAVLGSLKDIRRLGSFGNGFGGSDCPLI